MNPLLPSSDAQLFADISARLDRLERASRSPALTAAAATSGVFVDLAGVGASFAAWPGLASVDVAVPPSGRLLVMLAASADVEMSSPLAAGWFLAVAMSGANIAAASEAAGVWFTLPDGATRQDRPTWFFLADGLTPGVTTLTLQAKHTGSSATVTVGVTSQSIVAIPL